MTKWAKTPFTNLDAAHRHSQGMGLEPGPLKTKGEYRFFRLVAGSVMTVLAQKLVGGPVLETVGIKEPEGGVIITGAIASANQEAPASQWTVSPWKKSDEIATFEQAGEYWQQLIANPDNLEVLEIQLYRVGKTEYEYGLDNRGQMWVREITLI